MFDSRKKRIVPDILADIQHRSGRINVSADVIASYVFDRTIDDIIPNRNVEKTGANDIIFFDQDFNQIKGEYNTLISNATGSDGTFSREVVNFTSPPDSVANTSLKFSSFLTGSSPFKNSIVTSGDKSFRANYYFSYRPEGYSSKILTRFNPRSLAIVTGSAHVAKISISGSIPFKHSEVSGSRLTITVPQDGLSSVTKNYTPLFYSERESQAYQILSLNSSNNVNVRNFFGISDGRKTDFEFSISDFKSTPTRKIFKIDSKATSIFSTGSADTTFIPNAGYDLSSQFNYYATGSAAPTTYEKAYASGSLDIISASKVWIGNFAASPANNGTATTTFAYNDTSHTSNVFIETYIDNLWRTALDTSLDTDQFLKLGTSTQWQGISGNSSGHKNTFSCWVLPNVNQGHTNPHAIFMTQNDAYKITILANGKIKFDRSWSGTDYSVTTSASYFKLTSGTSGRFTTPDWTHVAVTYNGSSTSGVAYIYVNGALAATTTSATPSGTIATVADGSGTLNHLGASAAGAATTLRAKYADFGFWSKVLSANQIYDLYSRPLASYRANNSLQLYTSLGKNIEKAGSLAVTPAYTNSSLIGNVTSNTFGNRSYPAYTFLHEADRVDIGTAAQWDAVIGDGPGNPSMTFSAWINRTGSPTQPSSRILQFGNDNIIFYTHNDDTSASSAELRFYLNAGWSSGGLVYWKTAATAITNGTWHHVAVTYSSADVNQDPVLYIDGLPVATSEQSGPPAGSWAGITDGGASRACHIGNRHQADRPFNGKIAEVAIWNSLLSDSEIFAIYSATKLAYDNTALDVARTIQDTVNLMSDLSVSASARNENTAATSIKFTQLQSLEKVTSNLTSSISQPTFPQKTCSIIYPNPGRASKAGAAFSNAKRSTSLVLDNPSIADNTNLLITDFSGNTVTFTFDVDSSSDVNLASANVTLGIQGLSTKSEILNKLSGSITTNMESASAGTLTGLSALIGTSDLRLIARPKARFSVKCPAIATADKKTLVVSDTTGYQYKLYITGSASDAVPTGTLAVRTSASATAAQVATALEAVVESLPDPARSGGTQDMAINAAFTSSVISDTVTVISGDYGVPLPPIENVAIGSTTSFVISVDTRGDEKEEAVTVSGTAISNNFFQVAYTAYEFVDPKYNVPATGQKLLVGSFDGVGTIGSGDPRIGDVVVRYENDFTYLKFFDNLKEAISDPQNAGHIASGKLTVGSSVEGPTTPKNLKGSILRESKVSLLLRNSDVYEKPGVAAGKKLTILGGHIASGVLMDLNAGSMTINDGSTSRVISFVFSGSEDNKIVVSSVNSSNTAEARFVAAINGSVGGAINVTASSVSDASGNAEITLSHDLGGSITVTFTQGSANNIGSDYITTSTVSAVPGTVGSITFKSGSYDMTSKVNTLAVEDFAGGFQKAAAMTRGSTALDTRGQKTIIARLYNNESSGEGVIFSYAGGGAAGKSRYYLKADSGNLEFRIRPDGAANNTNYWKGVISRSSLAKDKWYTFVASFNESTFNVANTANYVALFDSENHGGQVAFANFIVNASAPSGDQSTEDTLGTNPRLFIGYGNKDSGAPTGYDVAGTTSDPASFYNNFYLAELSILNAQKSIEDIGKIAESHLVLRSKSGFKSELPKRSLSDKFQQPSIIEGSFTPFTDSSEASEVLSARDVIYPHMLPAGSTGSVVFTFADIPANDSGFSLRLPNGKDFQVIFDTAANQTKADGFTLDTLTSSLVDTNNIVAANAAATRFKCGINGLITQATVVDQVQKLIKNVNRYSGIPIRSSRPSYNTIKIEIETPGSFKTEYANSSTPVSTSLCVVSKAGNPAASNITVSENKLSKQKFSDSEIVDFSSTPRSDVVSTGRATASNSRATIKCSITNLESLVQNSSVTKDYIIENNLPKQLIDVQNLSRLYKDNNTPVRPVLRFQLHDVEYIARLDSKLHLKDSNKFNIGLIGVTSDALLAQSLANSINDKIVKDGLGLNVTIVGDTLTLRPKTNDESVSRTIFYGDGAGTTTGSMFLATGFNAILNPDMVTQARENLVFKKHDVIKKPFVDSDNMNIDLAFFAEGSSLSGFASRFGAATRNRVRIEIDINPVTKTTLGFTTGSGNTITDGFQTANYNPMGYFNFGSRKWESITPSTFSPKIETDRTAQASSTSRNQAIYDAVENFQKTAPIGFGGTYGFSIHRKDAAGLAKAVIQHASGSNFALNETIGSNVNGSNALSFTSDQLNVGSGNLTFSNGSQATSFASSYPAGTVFRVVTASPTNYFELVVGGAASGVNVPYSSLKGNAANIPNPSATTTTWHVITGRKVLVNDKITISSTDGTVKDYVICDRHDDTSIVTGTALANSTGDVDVYNTNADVTAKDSGVIVALDLSEAATTNQVLLTQLSAAIDHGHSGKISCSNIYPDLSDKWGTIIDASNSGTFTFDASGTIRLSKGFDAAYSSGNRFYFKFNNGHYRVYTLDSNVTKGATDGALTYDPIYSTTTVATYTTSTLSSWGYIDTTLASVSLKLAQLTSGPAGNTRIFNNVPSLRVAGHAKVKYKLKYTANPTHDRYVHIATDDTGSWNVFSSYESEYTSGEKHYNFRSSGTASANEIAVVIASDASSTYNNLRTAILANQPRLLVTNVGSGNTGTLTIESYGDQVSILEMVDLTYGFTSQTDGVSIEVEKTFPNNASDIFAGKYSSFVGGILTAENDPNKSAEHSDRHYAELPLRGRPVSNFGFPFSDTFKPSTGQKLNLAEYLDGPFLLEKFEIVCSSSIRDEVQEGMGRLLPETSDDLPFSNYGAHEDGFADNRAYSDLAKGDGTRHSYKGLYNDKFRNIEAQRLYERFYPHTSRATGFSALTHYIFGPKQKSTFTKERLKTEGAYHRVGGNVYARKDQPAANLYEGTSDEYGVANTSEGAAWWRCDTFFLMREKPCINTTFSVPVPGAIKSTGLDATDPVSGGRMSFGIHQNPDVAPQYYPATDSTPTFLADGVNWPRLSAKQYNVGDQSSFRTQAATSPTTPYIEITQHNPIFDPSAAGSLISGHTYLIAATGTDNADDTYLNGMTALNPFDTTGPTVHNGTDAAGNHFVANTTTGGPQNGGTSIKLREKPRKIRLYFARSSEPDWGWYPDTLADVATDVASDKSKLYDASVKYVIDIAYAYGAYPSFGIGVSPPRKMYFLLFDIRTAIIDAMIKGYFTNDAFVVLLAGELESSLTINVNNATANEFTADVLSTSATIEFSDSLISTYLDNPATLQFRNTAAYSPFTGGGAPVDVISSPRATQHLAYSRNAIERSDINSMGVETGFNMLTQSCNITEATRELISYAQVSYYGYANMNYVTSSGGTTYNLAHYYFVNDPGYLFFRGKDHLLASTGSYKQTMEHPHLSTFGSFEISGSNGLTLLENGLGRELNVKIGLPSYDNVHIDVAYSTSVPRKIVENLKFSIPKKYSLLAGDARINAEDGTALNDAQGTEIGDSPENMRSVALDTNASIENYRGVYASHAGASYNLHDGVLRVLGVCKTTPKLDSYFGYRLAVLDQYDNPSQASLPDFVNVTPRASFIGGYDFDGLGGTRANRTVTGDKLSGNSLKINQMSFYFDTYDRMDPSKSQYSSFFSDEITPGENFEQDNPYLLKPEDNIILGFQTATPGFHSGFTSFLNLAGGKIPTRLDDQGNRQTVHTEGARSKAIDTGKCIEATFAPYEKSKLVLYGSYIQNAVPKYPIRKEGFSTAGVVYSVIGEEIYDKFDLSLDSEFSGSMSSEIFSQPIIKRQELADGSLSDTAVNITFGTRTNDIGGSPKKLFTTGSVERYMTIYNGDDSNPLENHDVVYFDSLPIDISRYLKLLQNAPGKRIVPIEYLVSGSYPSLVSREISDHAMKFDDLAVFIGAPLRQKNVYFHNTLTTLYAGVDGSPSIPTTALTAGANVSINMNSTKIIDLLGVQVGNSVTFIFGPNELSANSIKYKVTGISSSTLTLEFIAGSAVTLAGAHRIKVESGSDVDGPSNLSISDFESAFITDWRQRFIFEKTFRNSDGTELPLFAGDFDPADSRSKTRKEEKASFGIDTEDSIYEFGGFPSTGNIKIFQSATKHSRSLVAVKESDGNIKYFDIVNQKDELVNAIAAIKAVGANYHVYSPTNTHGSTGTTGPIRVTNTAIDIPAIYVDQVDQVNDSPYRHAAALLFGFGSEPNRNLTTVRTEGVSGLDGQNTWAPLGVDGRFVADGVPYKLVPEHSRQTLEHPRGVKYGMLNYDHIRPKVVFSRSSYGHFSDLVQGRKFAAFTSLSSELRNSDFTAEGRTVPVEVKFFDPTRRLIKNDAALKYLFSQNLDKYQRSRVPFFDLPSPQTEGGLGGRVRRKTEVLNDQVTVQDSTGTDIFSGFDS